MIQYKYSYRISKLNWEKAIHLNCNIRDMKLNRYVTIWNRVIIMHEENEIIMIFMSVTKWMNEWEGTLKLILPFVHFIQQTFMPKLFLFPLLHSLLRVESSFPSSWFNETIQAFRQLSLFYLITLRVNHCVHFKPDIQLGFTIVYKLIWFS